MITYNAGELNITGETTKVISALSVKSTNSKYSSTELISNFNSTTYSYSAYVNSDTSAVTLTISRTAGSLITCRVKVNNSGYRKLNFSSNIASSGAVPVPTYTNTITILVNATDGSSTEYTVTILRDEVTKSTTNGVATPTPASTPPPASTVSFNTVKFQVNGVDIPISPTFNVSTTSYSANFTKDQSATQLITAFTATGITLRIKINDSAFKSISSIGSSTSLPLFKGVNTAILRVTSSDGTLTDYTFSLTRAAS